MIDNIVFDVGNVLAAFQWEVRFRRYAESEEMLARLAKATVYDYMWTELDRGVLSNEELLQGFIRNDPELAPVLEKCMESYEGMIRMYDYAVPWIRALKAQGYGVYYLSNMNWNALRDCKEELACTDETDGGIWSCQVHLVKPEPEIYQLFLERFCLDPKTCVFLDDSERNIQAARDAGMAGIVFQNQTQAEEELRMLGVRT